MTTTKCLRKYQFKEFQNVAMLTIYFRLDTANKHRVKKEREDEER